MLIASLSFDLLFVCLEFLSWSNPPLQLPRIIFYSMTGNSPEPCSFSIRANVFFHARVDLPIVSSSLCFPFHRTSRRYRTLSFYLRNSSRFFLLLPYYFCRRPGCFRVPITVFLLSQSSRRVPVEIPSLPLPFPASFTRSLSEGPVENPRRPHLSTTPLLGLHNPFTHPSTNMTCALAIVGFPAALFA